MYCGELQGTRAVLLFFRCSVITRTIVKTPFSEVRKSPIDNDKLTIHCSLWDLKMIPGNKASVSSTRK